MSSPKDFHMDTVYPEPLSRLRRGMPNSDLGSSASYRRAVKKQMHRSSSSGRFRTQPVTFHEIKEVDEENLTEVEIDSATGTAGAASKSESDLKAKFELFYRSISTNNENQLPQRRNQLSVGPSGEDGEEEISDLIFNPSLSGALQTGEIVHGVMAKDNSPSASSAPLVIPFNQKSRPSL